MGLSLKESPFFLISGVMAEKKDFDGKWLAIGVASGVALGAALSNIPLGLCIGVGIGGFATLVEQKKNKNKEEK